MFIDIDIKKNCKNEKNFMKIRHKWMQKDSYEGI